jgi:hypothetical protein
MRQPFYLWIMVIRKILKAKSQVLSLRGITDATELIADVLQADAGGSLSSGCGGGTRAQSLRWQSLRPHPPLDASARAAIQTPRAERRSTTEITREARLAPHEDCRNL